MKKHLSVLMLMARSTLRQTVGLLVLMAAAEGGLFWLTLERWQEENGYRLEQVITDSRIIWVFGVCFVLLTILLTRACRQVSGSYAAMRLSVSGRWVYFWQGVCCAACYLLLWAAQILIAIGLGRLYTALAPAEYVSGQTLFLAFYRSELFHALLPFEDALFWVRNAVMALGMGACAARVPGRTERGLWPQIFLGAAVVVFFPGGVGQALGGLIAAVLLTGAAVFNTLSQRGGEYYEEA